MKKKVITASLLTIGLAAGVGTRIHAQDSASICGENHSHMHNAAEGCMRTLKEQRVVKDAVVKRQAEDTQKQTQATQKQNAVNTTAQSAIKTETAENVSYTDSPQQPNSVHSAHTTAQKSTNTAASLYPNHENCDGNHQHNENCNNGGQGNHHKGGSGQGMHHSPGSGHHRR